MRMLFGYQGKLTLLVLLSIQMLIFVLSSMNQLYVIHDLSMIFAIQSILSACLLTLFWLLMIPIFVQLNIPSVRLWLLYGILPLNIIHSILLHLNNSFIQHISLVAGILGSICALVGLGLISRAIMHGFKIRKHEQARITQLYQQYDALSTSRLVKSLQLQHQTIPIFPLQSPRGLTLIGLTAKAWHNSNDYPWSKTLEAQAGDIRQEFFSLIQTKNVILSSYTYPGVNRKGWEVFKLIENGLRNEINCKLCPLTSELLKQIPGYPYFRDAMFSVLLPGAKIKSHHDHSNIFLTCHLCLLTNSEAELQVAGECRQWTENKCTIFDTSFAHSAWNTGDSARVILLVDFFHPELSEVERQFFTPIH